MNLSSADVASYLVALAFFLMACVALVTPATVGRYFQTPVVTIDMRNEVRAVYGGIGIATAVALIAAVRSESLRPGIIGSVALMLACMALARLASALFERPGRWPWVFCALEAVGACLLGVTQFA